MKLDPEELERKVKNLECPFCPYKAEHVSIFIQHVVRRHPLNDECPACSYKGREVLIHFSKRKDKVHEILWAIYGSSTKGHHQRPRRLMEIRSELWG